MSRKRTRRGFLAGAFATLGAGQALGAAEPVARGRPKEPRRDATLNVSDFGAIGDGKADDTAAFREALLAAAGRSLLVPSPKDAFRITGTLRVPEGTAVVGESRLAARVRLDANVPLFELGAWASLVSLHLDGNGRPGFGVSMVGTDGQQLVESCRITDFDAPCVNFNVMSGSGFSCISSLVYRRNAGPGTGKASIVIEDSAVAFAVPRKFVHLETGGRCSFSFGGGNSTYVASSFLADLVYSPNSKATLITNCRIATATPLVVRGGQNSIVGCDVYPEITLAEGTSGCVVGPNNYNNPPVVDRSGDLQNLVYCPEVRYAPDFASDGNVALGDGSIVGRWSRQGNVVNASIRFVTGRMTLLGTGPLRFSLPPGVPVPMGRGAPCGQVRIASGEAVAWGNLYRRAGASYVTVEGIQGTLTGRTGAWPPGTVLDAAIRYVL